MYTVFHSIQRVMCILWILARQAHQIVMIHQVVLVRPTTAAAVAVAAAQHQLPQQAIPHPVTPMF